eukprot:355767-Chlamydomonas_euryale.AAC.9
MLQPHTCSLPPGAEGLLHTMGCSAPGAVPHQGLLHTKECPHTRGCFTAGAVPFQQAGNGALPQRCAPQADPALAPLRCEARLASALSAVTHWAVRLEQHAAPLPPLALAVGGGDGDSGTLRNGSVYRRGCDGQAHAGTQPLQQQAQQQQQQQAQQQQPQAQQQQPQAQSQPRVQANTLQSGSASERSAGLPLRSELLKCEQVVRNRQSVWLLFELPRWVKAAAGGNAWNVSSCPRNRLYRSHTGHIQGPAVPHLVTHWVLQRRAGSYVCCTESRLRRKRCSRGNPSSTWDLVTCVTLGHTWSHGRRAGFGLN